MRPPIEMSCVLVRQSIHRLLVFLVNVKGFYSTKLSTLCRYLECVYQFLFLTKLVLNETSFSLCCIPLSILDQMQQDEISDSIINVWKNFLKRDLYIFFYGTIILKLLYVRFRILEFFKFIFYKNYTKFVDKCIKFSELLGKKLSSCHVNISFPSLGSDLFFNSHTVLNIISISYTFTSLRGPAKFSRTREKKFQKDLNPNPARRSSYKKNRVM